MNHVRGQDVGLAFGDRIRRLALFLQHDRALKRVFDFDRVFMDVPGHGALGREGIDLNIDFLARIARQGFRLDVLGFDLRRRVGLAGLHARYAKPYRQQQAQADPGPCRF
jgi:hypothetical protein